MSGKFDPPNKDLPPPPAPNRPLPPSRPPPALPKKEKKFPSHTMKLKASKHLEKIPESDSSSMTNKYQAVLGKLETNKSGEILPELPPRQGKKKGKNKKKRPTIPKRPVSYFFEGGKKKSRRRYKKKSRRTKKRKVKRTKKRRSQKRRKRKTRRR